MACSACLPVLYAEYDARRAANGGHFLFIPDDWDGPAKPVADKVRECADCGGLFCYRRLAQIRCPDCQAIATAVSAAIRHARTRIGKRKTGETRALGLALTHVV